jgi:hypothetical protein
MLFITPPPAKIMQALDSWQWIGFEGKEPIRITAFGDVFFKDKEGIWFLDTIEGTLEKICETFDELNKILNSTEGEDLYLLAGFVERAQREGIILEDDECYDFKINPVIGGKIEYENIEKRNFVVALHVAGQLHDKVRFMPEGTVITKFTFVEEQ